MASIHPALLASVGSIAVVADPASALWLSIGAGRSFGASVGLALIAMEEGRSISRPLTDSASPAARAGATSRGRVGADRYSNR